jgi:hypothetical protein
MNPTQFPQSNATLRAPNGMEKEVEPLHVYRDGTYHISKWNLNWKERLKVLFTGTLWLWIMSSHTQPPVSLDVKDPWSVKTESVLSKLGNKVGWFRRWKTRRAVRAAVREAMKEGGK